MTVLIDDRHTNTYDDKNKHDRYDNNIFVARVIWRKRKIRKQILEKSK